MQLLMGLRHSHPHRRLRKRQRAGWQARRGLGTKRDIVRSLSALGRAHRQVAGHVRAECRWCNPELGRTGVEHQPCL